MGDFDSDYGDDNFTILKGRFRAVETNTYGLFIIFFNGNLGTVESLMAIASHYSSLFDNDPHLPWYIIEENIINLRWKGDIAANISLDLQHFLEVTLERDRGTELFSLIRNNDETRMESLLLSVLIKPLGDRNIQLETVSELVTKQSMNMIREERNKPKEQNVVSQPGTSRGLSTVDVELILAPVSGIPIFELEVGDKIMVKITDRSTRGHYAVDLLGARVEGTLIPVPAEVLEISRGENNEYTIICKLGGDLHGKAVETEQVKLKRYDELLSKGAMSGELPSIDELSPRRKVPLFVMVVGGLFFVVVLAFLIMWFYNIL
ncbi:MAG: hypothetical protein JXQ30_04910 [Spirochaetes bacterium]|nr:hypothetical protein [Spirochaetota bacterium]